jgi:Saxitoxin biosynthesis operon protein SxtJ
VTFASVVDKLGHWYATRPTHTKILLGIATTMLVVELLLRNLAPKSELYASWTRFFLGLGKVWTVVLLSLLYLVAIGPMALVMRLMRNDPLDRTLAPTPTFWHGHEPNPMGPRASARYQF